MDRKALRQVLQEELEQGTDRRFEDLDDSISLSEGLGLDSVDLVNLIFQMQSRFTIELPSAELQRIGNVGELLDLLQSKLPGTNPLAA